MKENCVNVKKKKHGWTNGCIPGEYLKYLDEKANGMFQMFTMMDDLSTR